MSGFDEDQIRDLQQLFTANNNALITQLDERFEKIDGQFKRIDSRFEKLETKFDALHEFVAEAIPPQMMRTAKT